MIVNCWIFFCYLFVIPVILGVLNVEKFKTNFAKSGISCPKGRSNKKKKKIKPYPQNTTTLN